jgi:L-fuconolactonase
MSVVDSQLHIWDKDHPERPWDREFARATRWSSNCFTFERAIGAMDAVGVEIGVLASTLLYPDLDYLYEAVDSYPERFKIVPQFDLRAPKPEEQVREYGGHPGVIAMRFAVTPHPSDQTLYDRLRAGAFGPIFVACEQLELPLMLAIKGKVEEAGSIAKAHPKLQLIVDHLGMADIGVGRDYAPETATPSANPFERLDDLLALAKDPNVAVKVSAVPTVSKQPYPFDDLWPHLKRVVSSFEAERLMWGSNISRTWPMHTYAEALNYLSYSSQISESEKKFILEETPRRLLPRL